ncbi:MAG: cysteine hydrolase [Erysipelotrichia bacterium]|nr:cysteine hydrolase [Erysipelotrichia bacterium]
MNKKYAILVVDMLNDFVTGALGCDRAKAIIQPNKQLIEGARKLGVPIIFCNDSHLKGVDHELKHWGDHAIRGTKGAEVIPELPVLDEDYVILKRRYSSFFQTDLDILLKELGVTSVIITGLHTHMCCRHTAADAYQNNYEVLFAKEATNAFTEEDHLEGLKYAKEVYDAESLTNAELLDLFK